MSVRNFVNSETQPIRARASFIYLNDRLVPKQRVGTVDGSHDPIRKGKMPHDIKSGTCHMPDKGRLLET